MGSDPSVVCRGRGMTHATHRCAVEVLVWGHKLQVMSRRHTHLSVSGLSLPRSAWSPAAAPGLASSDIVDGLRIHTVCAGVGVVWRDWVCGVSERLLLYTGARQALY
jgi:hypothetical protein